MKKIAVITVDPETEEGELEEKLLHTEGIISDEISNFCSEIKQLFKKYGFPNDAGGKKAEKEWSKWEEKSGYFNLQWKYEEIFLNKIYKYLLKEDDDSS
jgi:hypothetical protein